MNSLLSEGPLVRTRGRPLLLSVFSFLILAALWQATASIASADDRFGPPWSSMVTGAGTIVYSKPDPFSAPIGPLPGGAVVVVSKNLLGPEGQWVQIQSGYISKVALTDLTSEWVAEVSASAAIPVYSKPNPNQGIRRTAKPGDLLRVTGVAAGVDGDNHIWWSTTEGYVGLDTIKLSTSPWAKTWSNPDGALAPKGWWGTITSQANVRAGASANAPVVGSFGGGERVKVLAEEQGDTVSGSNKWYVIDGGRYAGGRVHSSLIKRIADPRPNTTPPSSGPAPLYIVVDRSAFSLTLVKDGKPAFVTYVALGLAGVDTPKGTYSTFGKFVADRMTSRSVQGATHSYDLPNVPYTQYYKDGGFGIHGTYWHDLFGTRESQGCINVTWADSEYLFSQTGPHLNPNDDHLWQSDANPATPVVIVD